MNHSNAPWRTMLLTALVAGGVTALTAIAFAGWLGHGAAIFLSMAESGLAWCF
ncbi:hypothetical protein [Sinorhizobium sp. BG8]|uniref:hypothetical protein n=1 Tax=Sinorhizobium sp. BG8 TaxID=2613773 RepID=UPI00193DC513|nr:hypothetical protein [Sinorhizobium sp. BG8]